MSGQSPPEREVTVLAVDDEPETVDLLSRWLEPEFTVIEAFGGKAALQEVDEDVDVVLLDRRMPDIQGDDVLAEIRERGLDCRVVMVTAVEPDIDVISLDFDEYLVKPVDAETVRDAVERMLTRNEIDEHLLEAFALSSKMATLESKMDPVELERSEEYRQLEARLAEFRGLIKDITPDDTLYGELSKMKLEALFSEQ